MKTELQAQACVFKADRKIRDIPLSLVKPPPLENPTAVKE